MDGQTGVLTHLLCNLTINCCKCNKKWRQLFHLLSISETVWHSRRLSSAPGGVRWTGAAFSAWMGGVVYDSERLFQAQQPSNSPSPTHVHCHRGGWF